MNARSYKTVFSKRLGTLVAVGEHASSQGKANGAGSGGGAGASGTLGYIAALTASFALVSLAWAAPATNALPTAGQVVQGAASMSQAANQLTINQGTQRAAINWQSFDIGAQAKVQVVQPNAQAILLNRVVGQSPSQIFGQLQANGHVILVNPNGVLFGKDGSVNAASFTASTLGISDANFMAGNMVYERNGSTAGIVNEGTITTAPGGYVALLGASVSNQGQINTQGGNAFLGAADTIKVPVSSTGRIKLELTAADMNANVSNTGSIITQGGQVYMQALALNQAAAQIIQSGSIDTTGEQGGAVHLLADGGNIKVDGSITANSRGAGNKGGDIVIGRDEVTGVLAKSTDVSGSHLTTSKGFVETSGHFLDVDGAKVIAKDWLLDPDNIDITSDLANATTGYSKIKASDISNALNAGTAVTVSTTAGVTPSGSISYTAANPGDGNIVVNADITKTTGPTTGAKLTLLAYNGITVNNKISSTSGTLDVEMTALGNTSVTNNATKSQGIVLNKMIDANGGVVTLTGTNKNTGAYNSGILFNNGSGINAGSFTVMGNATGLYAGDHGVSIAGGSNGVSFTSSSTTVTSVINGTSKSDGVTGGNNAINAGTNINGTGISFNALNGGSMVVKGSNTATKLGLRVSAGGDNTTIATNGNVTLGALEANSGFYMRAGNITANSGSLNILGQTSTGTGVGMYGGNTVTATNGLSVNIEGKATGAGRGVYIGDTGASTINASQGTASQAGDITIRGTSEQGMAVEFKNSTTVNAKNINVTGTANAAQYAIRSVAALTATNNITLDGTSKGWVGVAIEGGSVTATNGLLKITGHTTAGGYQGVNIGSTVRGASVDILGDSVNHYGVGVGANGSVTSVVPTSTSAASAEAIAFGLGDIKINGTSTSTRAGRNGDGVGVQVQGLVTAANKLSIEGTTKATSAQAVNILNAVSGNRVQITGTSDNDFGVGISSAGSVVTTSTTPVTPIATKDPLKSGDINIEGSSNGNTASAMGINIGGAVTATGALTIKGDVTGGTGSAQGVYVTKAVQGTSVSMTGTSTGTSGVDISAGVTASNTGIIYIEGKSTGKSAAIKVSGTNVAITGGSVTMIGDAATNIWAGQQANNTGIDIAAQVFAKDTNGAGVVLKGYGGNGNYYNQGVWIQNAGLIDSQSTINIYGENKLATGGGKGNAAGVQIGGQSGNGVPPVGGGVRANGNIFLEGNVGNPTTNAFYSSGLLIQNAVTSTGGDISATASTVTAEKIALVISGNGALVANQGNQKINLTANTIEFGSAMATKTIDAGSAGSVNITSKDAGIAIKLGLDDVRPPNQGYVQEVRLNQTELNKINAGQTVIGDMLKTSDITVSSGVTTKPTNSTDPNAGHVTLQTSKNIIVNNTISAADGKNLTLQANGDVTVGAAISQAGAGNIVIAAGLGKLAGDVTGSTNAGSGQVRRTGTTGSISNTGGGKTYIYTGTVADSATMSQLNSAFNTLSLGTNAQSNTATDLANTISGGGNTQVMYREKIAVNVSGTNSLNNATKTYGDVSQSTVDSDAQTALKGANANKTLIWIQAGNTFNLSSDKLIETLSVTGSTFSTAQKLKASGTAYGTSSSTYSVTPPQTLPTLKINVKDVTYSGVGVDSKVYDGTTTALLNGTAAMATVTAGSSVSTDTKVITTDNVTLSGTVAGTFASKNVRGTDNAGANTVTLTGASLSGADASNYNLIQQAPVTANSKITAKDVTYSGVGVNSKVYDGTMTANLNGTAALATVTTSIATDKSIVAIDASTVNLGGTVAGTFASKNVRGTDNAGANTVTLTGASLSGADASNYNLIQQAPVTANSKITAKDVTYSGVGVNSKVYDGTTTANLNGAAALATVATGASVATDKSIVAIDASTVSIGGTVTGTFANKNVRGTDGLGANTVTLTGASLSGADASNYNLIQQAPVVANNKITAKDVTYSGVGVNSKVYDGTITANLNGAAALATVATGASVATDKSIVAIDASTVSVGGTVTGTFANKNVRGTDGFGANSVTLAGASLSGADASNYNLIQQAPVAANNKITAKTITVSGLSVNNKTYDGTKVASVTDASSLSTVAVGSSIANDNKLVAGDNVSLTGTAVGTYDSKYVAATGNKVTFTGKALSKAVATGVDDVSNYNLVQQAQATGDGTITSRPLTIAVGTVAEKKADGTTTANVTPGALGNLVAGESLVVTVTAANFSDANAGVDKVVTARYALQNGTNGLASNYILNAITPNPDSRLRGNILTSGNPVTPITPSPVNNNTGSRVSTVSGFGGSGAATGVLDDKPVTESREVCSDVFPENCECQPSVIPTIEICFAPKRVAATKEEK